MLELITGNIWKGVSGLLAIAAIGLGLALVGMHAEVVSLRDRIENPQTGYIAQVARSETAIEQLRVNIDAQNASITQMARERDARMAEAQKQIDAANLKAADAEQQIATLLAPSTQATVCDQLLDADRRLMETLQK